MTSAAEARQGLVDLTALAHRDLATFWALVRDWPADQIRDALMDVLPALGNQYGDAAAELAASYFETARERAAAGGSFAPVLAERPQRARWEALTRWGVDPLFAAEPDAPAALSRVSGGLQRTIADQHRLTVVESSLADPAASGWRRVGVGDNCGFCRMLIDRGHVYTEAGVTFRSHDHCNCAAAPSWDSNVVKVSTEPYRQSQKNRSDVTRKADNARARAYIADKYGN